MLATGESRVEVTLERIALALVFVGFFAFAPRVASATDTVAVKLEVTDPDGRVVPAARVSLADGASIAITDPKGQAEFSALAGSVLVVRLENRRAQFIAKQGTISVILPYLVVGTATARVDSRNQPEFGTAAAAVALGDVADALSFVPNFRTMEEGGSGLQTVNGIPLQLPPPLSSTSSAAGGISGDLIERFTVGQADDGSVTPNFQLLSPTEQPSQTFSAQEYSRGSVLKASATGRQQRLGYAFSIVDRTDGGTLQNEDLFDASGLRYDHSLGLNRLNGSTSLTLSFPTTSISLSGFGSRQTNNFIETTQPAALLSGVGPNNSEESSSGTGWILATQTLGHFSMHALGVMFGGAATENLENAIFYGMPEPSYSGYSYSGTYSDFLIQNQSAGGSVSLRYGATRVNVRGIYNSSEVVTLSGTQSLALSAEEALGRGRIGATLAATHEQSANLSGSSLNGSGFLSSRFGKIDTRLSAYVGPAQTQQVSYVNSTVPSPPTSASVDCSANDAIVQGTSALTGSLPRAFSLSARIHAQLAEGDLTVGGFSSNTSHGLVQAVTSAPASTLPPNYAESVAGVASVLCGRQTIPQIFVNSYTQVASLVGNELYVDYGYRKRGWQFDVAYEVFSLSATSVLPVGAATTSLVSQEQLADVPLHRAQATVSYGRGSAIGALAAQYVDGNNPARLPGHVVLSAGLRVPVEGTRQNAFLSIAAQNIFGKYSGAVSSPQFSVPLPSNHEAIGVLATPLVPTWMIRLTVHTGPSTNGGFGYV
jgi:hypothetical protein